MPEIPRQPPRAVGDEHPTPAPSPGPAPEPADLVARVRCNLARFPLVTEHLRRAEASESAERARPTPDAPPPPTGCVDARITNRQLTVIVYGPKGPAGAKMSAQDTWALYQMMKRNLEPSRLDGNQW